ncbi:MAG TPA: sporulation protein [Phytomonospora sp.]
MVFKKMLRKLGVGGPSVDTVLDHGDVRPGEQVTGRVHVEGGDHDVAIDHVALSLVTRVEAESGDHEFHAPVEFSRQLVSGPFALAAGQRHSIPFTVEVPWETPVTRVSGQHLHGMTLGVRTELAVAKAVDKGDLDPLSVTPLPSQERVLDALGRVGFSFRKADLEHGRVYGLHQELPFFQEIEFHPPRPFAGRIGEVELTFVADRHHLAVVLEADRRGGVFGGGGDDFGRWIFPHEVALRTDWEGMVDGWLTEVASRTGHHGHRAGGAVVAGVAGGLVGGMVLGEVLDEIGDAFDGGED